MNWGDDGGYEHSAERLVAGGMHAQDFTIEALEVFAVRVSTEKSPMPAEDNASEGLKISKFALDAPLRLVIPFYIAVSLTECSRVSLAA